MNKILSIIVVLAYSIFADTLYLKNGQEIEDAVVIEIDDINVKYKTGQKQVIYTTKKSNVVMILYEDGTKDIFNSEQEERQIAETPKLNEEKSKRYGSRAAVCYSYLFFEEYRTLGGGIEIGFPVSIPIENTITFNPEVNFILRGFPDIYNRWEDVNVTEFAINIPVLFQWMPLDESKFYLEGGVQLDFPIVTKINFPDESEEYPNINRAVLDFGIVLGFGWHFENVFGINMFGIRTIIGLTDTGLTNETNANNSSPTRLFSFSFSVSYLY